MLSSRRALPASGWSWARNNYTDATQLSDDEKMMKEAGVCVRVCVCVCTLLQSTQL